MTAKKIDPNGRLTGNPVVPEQSRESTEQKQSALLLYNLANLLVVRSLSDFPITDNRFVMDFHVSNGDTFSLINFIYVKDIKDLQHMETSL